MKYLFAPLAATLLLFPGAALTAASLTYSVSIPASSLIQTSQNPAIFDDPNNPINQKQEVSSPSLSPSLVPGYPDDINAIATACQYDPKKLFDFVHNNIRFLPYYGFRKDAVTTWLTRSGNDADQCVLLAQLLGASGYSAQYQVIDFSMPIVDAEAWFGVSNATALSEAVGTANYYSYVDTANQVLQIEMISLVANINGTNYRMLPAYKTFTTLAGIDLVGAMSYSHSGLMTAAGGTTTALYAQNISESGISGYISNAAMNLVNQIRTNHPNAATDEIIGGRRIISNEITGLSQCFPASFNIFAASGLYSSPPWNYSDQLIMGLGIGGQVNTYAYNTTANLCGGRLSMTFAPDGHAQIWKDDTLLAEEPTPISGGNVVLYLQITHPGGSTGYNETRVVPIQRGNTYVVVNDMGGFDQPGLVTRRRAVVDGYRRQGLAASSRQMTCEALNLLGLGWSSQFEQGIGLIGQISGVATPVFHHSLAVFRQIQGGPFGTDIDSSWLPIPADGNATKAYAARNAELILGSAMEHGILQQLYPGMDAVSTVRFIEDNNANGWKTYLATAANYSAILADSGNLSNWPGYNSYFGQLLSSSSTAELIIPQNGLHQFGQLSNSGGYFQWDTSFLAAYISFGQNYNGGLTTTNGTVDPTKDPTPKDGTQGPNDGNDDTTEPIDLYTGAYVSDRDQLTLGGDGAKGLNFSLHYSSDQRGEASPLGTGWNHSNNSFLSEYTNTASAFGQTTPVAATTMIAVCYVLNDSMLNESSNAKGWVVSSVTAKWALDQIRSNTVALTSDRKNYAFNRLSDGSFAPSAKLTAQLSKDSGTGLYSIAERFGRTIYFDAQKYVSSYVDADGKTLTYGYGNNEVLQSVTDCYGRSLTFSYYTSGSGAGLLQSVSDSTGRSVSYTYDGLNRLASATDPENHTVQFGYDSADRLQTITDQTGSTLAVNSYDSNDRLTQQVAEGDSLQTWTYAFTGLRNIETKPSGETTTWLYDSKGRNTGIIDGRGNRSTMFYDGQDQLIQTTDPRGFNTFLQYDGSNNLRFVTNASSHTVEYRYDGANHLVKSFDALGKETDFGYDAHHHLNQVTDPLSRVTGYTYYLSGGSAGLLENVTEPGEDFTQFQYDSNGFPNQITRADGSVVTPTYNARGDLLNTVTATTGDPNIHSQGFSYDKRRLLLSSTDAFGFGPVNVFDARGFLAQQIDRFGNTSHSTYSPWGRLQAVAAPSGAVTTSHYDSTGRRDSTTNPLSQTTLFGYDGASRLTTVANALMETGSSGFDAVGNRNAFSNPRGKSYSWTFTPINLTGTLTTPLGRTIGNTYDNRDLLWTVKQPSGNTTTLTYFDDRRLHQSADPVGTIDYEYDSKGRLYTVTEGTKVIKHEYDSLDRQKKFTDGAGNVLQYQYDGAGNLTVLTYPDNKTVTYVYDSADRLDHVTDWATRMTQYAYDSHSRLHTISFPNGTVRTYGYDNAGRVNLIQDSGSNGAIISKFALDHDSLDRISKETVTPESAPFSIIPASMTVDDDDRLATWNGQTTVSDADGNLTTGPLGGSLTTFGFDARNRLSGVGNTTYTYDAENRRVAQTISGVTTAYVNDPQGALSRLLVAATVSSTTRYVYANGLLLYQDNGSDIRVHHYDPRGSTVAITGSTGNVTDRIVYGDYGEIVATSGMTATPFLFNGAYGVQTDPNGLCFMRARYYSTETRRFLSADPLGFGGGNNWFGFVAGNPANYFDPMGDRWVTVYIWEPSVFKLSPGHVYIGETNNAPILSQFPDPHGVLGSNTTFDWSQTNASEGSSPDHTYRVFVPDDTAFNAAAAYERQKPYWWAFPLPSSSSSTNCTVAADNALNAGGVPVDLSNAIDTPDNFNYSMGELINREIRDAKNGNPPSWWVLQMK